MWNLLVFGVIGLVSGAAIRLFYRGRQARQILGTLARGVLGALTGGVMSWAWWPDIDDQFRTGNLLLSFLGAIIAVLVWEGVAYARDRNGSRVISPMTPVTQENVP